MILIKKDSNHYFTPGDERTIKYDYRKFNIKNNNARYYKQRKKDFIMAVSAIFSSSNVIMVKDL